MTVRRWLEVVNDLELTLVNQLGPDKRFPFASRELFYHTPREDAFFFI